MLHHGQNPRQILPQRIVDGFPARRAQQAGDVRFWFVAGQGAFSRVLWTVENYQGLAIDDQMKAFSNISNGPDDRFVTRVITSRVKGKMHSA